jgi:phosphohistidine phosphatase
MKQLLLVRHAKSGWENPELKDFDRPLNERGKQNAPEMGKRLSEKKWSVDLIISSPAKRALKTARLLAKEINYATDDIDLNHAIYEASIDDLIEVLHQQSDTAKSIVMVGHNPGISYFLGFLAGEFMMDFPTCGMAYLELNITSWKQLKMACAKVIELDYPKRIQQQDPN